MGGDGLGFRTIIGTAERSIAIVSVYSDRIFGNGEIVLVGLAPRYNGYNAASGCPVVVGNNMNSIQEKWIKDVAEALCLTREALKPGLTGIEIDRVPREYPLSKGYGEYMTMPFVHNSGLCEFEKPFFGPSSQDIVKENQVICIDIAMFGNKDIPGIRMETAYLVSGNGAVPMSNYLNNMFESLRAGC